jgi:hypothetical protein
MRTIQFVPGNIVAGNNITIPTPAPDIDTVVSAEITRLPTALGVADHTGANVALCFGNHTPAQVIACFQNHTQAQVVDAFADHGAAAVALGVTAHTQAQIVAAIANHPDHAHDLLVAIAAVAEAYGASGAGALDLESFTGQNIPGAVATGGVQNNAAAQGHVAALDVAHVAGANVDHAEGIPVPHVGVADLAHVVGAALAHGAAADPVVPVAALTKFSTRIIRLTAVTTLLGDLLTLNYLEVGERILVS